MISPVIFVFILSTMCASAQRLPKDPFVNAVVSHGGIIRMDTTQKKVYLVFTGHEFADGMDLIHDTLRTHGVRASFFFTGDFYRKNEFAGGIRRLRDAGHFLGAHSDRHLLYVPWEKRDSLLVDRESLQKDIGDNYAEMARLDISRRDAAFFMPPYEWYNETIASWVSEMGLILVNFTPGTRTNADYTTPSMGESYVSSSSIEKRLLEVELRDGLNGHILLLHVGTDPGREDKLYDILGAIVTELRARGYDFGSFSDFQK